MSDQSDEVRKLGSRIDELESENEALRHEAEEVETQHEAELESLRGEISLLEEKISELEGSVDVDREQEHEEELDCLRDEILLLEEKISDLEESLAVDPEEELGDLRAENAVLAEQLEQAEAKQGSDEERVYLASNGRHHFHRPHCEWAAYIPKYKLIEFSSHAEAVEAGFKPCKTCRA